MLLNKRLNTENTMCTFKITKHFQKDNFIMNQNSKIILNISDSCLACGSDNE